jgi:hypothetical protein
MGFHEDDVERAMRDVRSKTIIAELPPRTSHDAPRTVLCLHAGNLPLVGWHDVVSVHRAGMAYVGKLSKKDPHLGAWIREWLPEARISTELDDFTDLRADAVLFSGSADSVPAVMQRLKDIGAVHEHTRYLIRTAHTSLAWVDSLDADTMKDLAEGIARYDGQGCRSVRYVYSPYSFDEAKEALMAASAMFSDRTLFPRNDYRKAYLNSIGKSHIQVGRLLVSDTDPLWDDDDAVVWVHADRAEMLEHAQRLGTGLQQLYFTTERMEGGRWEPLSEAQKPGIDWQPDGVDVIKWLLQGVSREEDI